MNIEKMMSFNFLDKMVDADWRENAPAIFNTLVDEIKPIINAPLEDNEASYKERLRKYQEYLNRLAFMRATTEQFQQHAYSQKIIYHGDHGNNVTMAKELASKDCEGPTYLMALCKFIWEALKEGKSSIQSLLNAEIESRWAGRGAS